jgi:enoyl-CoA hydratase/carnithine racemase
VPEVAVDTTEGVRTVCIDRESKRNALNRSTLLELEAAFVAAGRDPEVRVIVLRGAGERAFCAGADLAEVLDHESIEASRTHFDAVARVIGAMQRAGPPVVARVPGYALAGGCGLAVAADFTLASESARFGLPEIGIGLLPLMVSAPIYRALGSRKRLLDLVLTGRQVDAAEAREIGLVTRVVPDAQLDPELAALTRRLASLSPSALRLGKEAVYTLCEMDEGASLKYLREAIVLTSRTEDAREGIRAFFEKREPVWKGR